MVWRGVDTVCMCFTLHLNRAPRPKPQRGARCRPRSRGCIRFWGFGPCPVPIIRIIQNHTKSYKNHTNSYKTNLPNHTKPPQTTPKQPTKPPQTKPHQPNHTTPTKPHHTTPYHTTPLYIYIYIYIETNYPIPYQPTSQPASTQNPEPSQPATQNPEPSQPPNPPTTQPSSHKGGGECFLRLQMTENRGLLT